MLRSRSVSRQQGSVIVEMSIGIPVLIILAIGMIDLGRGIAARAALGHAARAAVRYASVRSTTSDDPVTTSKVQTYVRNHVEGLDPSMITVTPSWSPNNTRGATVHVALSYPFEPIVPFIPVDSIWLTTSSEAIISN